MVAGASIIIGLLALAALIILAGAIAFAIAYPFGVIARNVDKRIALHRAVQRRLGLA